MDALTVRVQSILSITTCCALCLLRVGCCALVVIIKVLLQASAKNSTTVQKQLSQEKGGRWAKISNYIGAADWAHVTRRQLMKPSFPLTALAAASLVCLCDSLYTDTAHSHPTTHDHGVCIYYGTNSIIPPRRRRMDNSFQQDPRSP